jgi:hypothetical protein
MGLSVRSGLVRGGEVTMPETVSALRMPTAPPNKDPTKTMHVMTDKSRGDMSFLLPIYADEM